MQRRLNQKLSKALKATNDDNPPPPNQRRSQTSTSSRNRNKPEQRVKESENIVEDADEQILIQQVPERSYYYERDNYDEPYPKRQEPVARVSTGRISPRSPLAADFHNSRLGAFLPGTCDLPRRPSRSPSPSRLNAYGQGNASLAAGSKGFVLDDLEEDDEDEENEQQVPERRNIERQQDAYIENDDDDEDDDDEDEEDDLEVNLKPSNQKKQTISPSKTGRNLKNDNLQGNSTLRNSSSTSVERGRNISTGKPVNLESPSPSRDRLGRRASLKQMSSDVLQTPPSGVSSSNSFIRPTQYGNNSSTRIPGAPHTSYAIRNRSRSGSGNQLGSSSSSREVMPLAIEIPDSVTDEDAFRRYLAVRRGANIDIRPQIVFEDNNTSYESVGGGGPSKLPATMGVGRQQRGAVMGPETTRRTMSLSFAIITLALLSASASQLRFLIAYSKAHSYPILNYFLVCICIIIEIVVGVGYVVLSRFNFSDAHVETAQSYLISGLFIVAICNVIIAAFAFDDHVCEVLAKQTEQFDTVDQTST